MRSVVPRTSEAVLSDLASADVEWTVPLVVSGPDGRQVALGEGDPVMTIVAEEAGRGARSPVRPGLAGTELPDPNGLP